MTPKVGNVGKVTNIQGVLDPVGSWWPGIKNEVPGAIGHLDYFKPGNIDKVADIVTKVVK